MYIRHRTQQCTPFYTFPLPPIPPHHALLLTYTAAKRLLDREHQPIDASRGAVIQPAVLYSCGVQGNNSAGSNDMGVHLPSSLYLWCIVMLLHLPTHSPSTVIHTHPYDIYSITQSAASFSPRPVSSCCRPYPTDPCPSTSSRWYVLCYSVFVC